MKNIILVFVLLFTTSLVSLSQHTFETLISNPADQIIDGLLEDDDGNLLFVGRSITEGQPNSFSDYLFKLDKAGNILYENFDLVSDTVSSYMSNIFYINENYYLIGALNNLTLLSFTKLDKNLQLLNYKTFPILEKRWFSYMNSMVDSDTNFVVTGYITKYDTVGGNVYLNWDAFFYKISLLGDSISSRFYTNDANRWYFSFDILESADKSKYYAYVSHFVDSSLGYDSQRLSLDKNFDSITIDLIPLRIYDPNSPLYINETDVLISGKGMGKDFLYHHVIATHNEAGEIINYNKFKKGSYREHPPMKNAISKFGDNIYVGGNSNFDFSNPFWSGQKSWFHLVKVEPDLSVIWEKWFGGDAYYFMYNLLATRDGGCVMVGTRYDAQTQNQERDIYVIKVNSEGLLVWERELALGHRFSTLYPNPGSKLNIRLAEQHTQAVFSLFDQEGKMVLQQQLNDSENVIDVAHLQAGLYLYRIVTAGGTSESGKWIKN